MKNENGITVESIYTGPLDFIDVNYTNLNQTIRYEQRQRGEWEQVGEMTYKCTKCGWLKKTGLMPYCENCGSDNRKTRGG